MGRGSPSHLRVLPLAAPAPVSLETRVLDMAAWCKAHEQAGLKLKPGSSTAYFWTRSQLESLVLAAPFDVRLRAAYTMCKQWQQPDSPAASWGDPATHALIALEFQARFEASELT